MNAKLRKRFAKAAAQRLQTVLLSANARTAEKKREATSAMPAGLC